MVPSVFPSPKHPLLSTTDLRHNPVLSPLPKQLSFHSPLQLPLWGRTAFANRKVKENLGISLNGANREYYNKQSPSKCPHPFPAIVKKRRTSQLERDWGNEEACTRLLPTQTHIPDPTKRCSEAAPRDQSARREAWLLTVTETGSS